MDRQDSFRILHIENEAFSRELVRPALSDTEPVFDLCSISTQEELEKELANSAWDCALSDMHLDGFTGIDVLKLVVERSPDLPVVILASTGSEELAVEAMKLGAANYILKTPNHIASLPYILQGVVKSARDARIARHAEIELQLAATVFNASGEGILITDAQSNILAANPLFYATTGYSAAEIVGRKPNLLKSGVHDALFYEAIWESLAQTGMWRGEITNKRKDGSYYTEWLTISGVSDAAGKVTHYVGHFSDVAERRVMKERLFHLTQYDALTNLPNRTLLADRLEQTLKNAVRYERSVALLVIDLAGFRTINEMHGHGAGDKVLIETARRLTEFVRSGDTVARSGADDFAIVMTNLKQDKDAVLLAQRILDRIAQPVDIGNHRLMLSANIGIGLFPKDGMTTEILVKAADIALDRSRQSGRGTFRFFTKEMDADTERRMRLEADLRHAFERKELCLYYQPQIDLITCRICGYEALLRWAHPEFGPISPAQFIPLAEECGLIDPIGAWVIEEACRQNQSWVAEGHPLLPMAVNVSARQFQNSDLLAIVTQSLAVTGLPGAGLELEITESAFLDDLVKIAFVLDQIKSLGVLLALDDFGTGYSSLSQLSSLPFDKIKIDQGFIRDVVSNPINAAIVNATIAMGRSLNMTVLAEGVENEAQFQFLRNRQCEAMQGWLFSKALTSEHLGKLLVSGKRLEVGACGTATDTLLIVDDEPNILNALRRLLRREYYEVLTANSPREAFDLLAQHSVQVVVSDQRMPDMTGTEFLARVKQIYPATVRIVLSGYTDLETLTDAINRGAIYRFLVKPWNDEELRSQLREAFRVAHGIAHA
jgi:diguanylate cyclase (GGDEF)-like protein/PAS domain S-box-containing protein